MNNAKHVERRRAPKSEARQRVSRAVIADTSEVLTEVAAELGITAPVSRKLELAIAADVMGTLEGIAADLGVTPEEYALRLIGSGYG